MKGRMQCYEYCKKETIHLWLGVTMYRKWGTRWKFMCMECNQIKEYTQDYDHFFEITWLGDEEKSAGK